ncbi:MAG: hypothetical protein C0467_31285 [Planctomycetaceae bacterium]|nr:hypothetical protein [Planctomycetaceae bacterium]
MAGVQWAAELRDGLRASGTGKGKLDAISEAMAERFDHPAHAGKPDDHPDRHLTAAEALDLLRQIGAGEYTIDKAKQLIEKGQIKPVEQPTGRGERLPKPPRIPAPMRPVTVEGREPPRSIAGVEERTVGDGDTIGLKPIEKADAQADKRPAKKPATVKRGKKAKVEEAEASEPRATIEATEGAEPNEAAIEEPAEPETPAEPEAAGAEGESG